MILLANGEPLGQERVKATFMKRHMSLKLNIDKITIYVTLLIISKTQTRGRWDWNLSIDNTLDTACGSTLWIVVTAVAIPNTSTSGSSFKYWLKTSIACYYWHKWNKKNKNNEMEFIILPANCYKILNYCWRKTFKVLKDDN